MLTRICIHVVAAVPMRRAAIVGNIAFINGLQGKITLYGVAHGFAERLAFPRTEITIFDCSFSACGCFIAYGGYGQALRVMQFATPGAEAALFAEPREVFSQVRHTEGGVLLWYHGWLSRAVWPS